MREFHTDEHEEGFALAPHLARVLLEPLEHGQPPLGGAAAAGEDRDVKMLLSRADELQRPVHRPVADRLRVGPLAVIAVDHAIEVETQDRLRPEIAHWMSAPSGCAIGRTPLA